MKTREIIHVRNVLINVDMQHDFIDGSLAVKDGEQIVDPINQLSRAVRRSMGRVAFTRDWHPAITPHFADYGGLWPVHCVAGTQGAEFHPDLEILPGDVIISKGMGQTDGYSGTEGISDDGQTLESLIDPKESAEQVNVYLDGIATEFCVKETGIKSACRFANNKNIAFYAIADAMRAVNLQPNDDAKALAEMQSVGIHIITLDEALRNIDTSRLER
ncbi:MAG: isochorismatase family protein [Candidatus Saccharimonas sp.]